jgi:pimeloyl-ACP methyl ester carboxylesterase
MQDTAGMIPAAARLSRAYDRLRVPTSLIAGGDDKLVPPRQSETLHRKVPWSHLEVVPNAGHMVHHSAGARVAAALRLAMQHD